MYEGQDLPGGGMILLEGTWTPKNRVNAHRKGEGPDWRANEFPHVRANVCQKGEEPTRTYELSGIR